MRWSRLVAVRHGNGRSLRRLLPTANGLPTSPMCGDSGRLALCRCHHRSVLPSRGRLVDECRDDGRTRDRRPGDGGNSYEAEIGAQYRRYAQDDRGVVIRPITQQEQSLRMTARNCVPAYRPSALQGRIASSGFQRNTILNTGIHPRRGGRYAQVQ